MSEPTIVDRATWRAEGDALPARENAHTRAGDLIAAARRRLPTVEMDPAVTVVGPHGPVPPREAFEGRRQLVAYFHMWHDGAGDAGRCEGCTYDNGQVRELSYLHARDVTYATFCQGDDESVRYRYFMGWDVPWYSARDSGDALLAGRGVEVMAPTYGLPDMTVFGRQETWEESPPGWPQHWDVTPDLLRADGRPTAQWSRLAGVSS